MLNGDQFPNEKAHVDFLKNVFNGSPPPTEHEDKRSVMQMMRMASNDYSTGPEGVQLRGWGRHPDSGSLVAHFQVDRKTPSLRAMYREDARSGEIKDISKSGSDERDWREYD